MMLEAAERDLELNLMRWFAALDFTAPPGNRCTVTLVQAQGRGFRCTVL